MHTTDVDHAAVVAAAQHRVVEHRSQRSTFTACCYVSMAKIGYGLYTGCIGDALTAAKLQRKRLFGVGSVADGLAMAADGDNFVCIGAGYGEQFQRGCSKLVGDYPVESMQLEHGCIIQQHRLCCC